MVGRFVGLLVGWFVGGFVCWYVGGLVGWRVGRFFVSLFSWFVSLIVAHVSYSGSTAVLRVCLTCVFQYGDYMMGLSAVLTILIETT